MSESTHATLSNDGSRIAAVRRCTSREAARILGVKTATLANWRCRGEGPQGWLRLSPTTVVYDRDVVEEWLRGRHVKAEAALDARDDAPVDVPVAEATP